MTVPDDPLNSSAPAMKVSQLYLYPIKSLRPTNISRAEFTRHGFPYDRSFMLINVQGELGGKKRRSRNMAVAYFPEMSLFLTDVKYPEGGFEGEITVTYAPPEGEKKTIIVPLQPDTAELDPIDVNMHGSPTTGFNMGEQYNSWFSSCFGYPVVFVYIGNNKRSVFFPEVNDSQQQSQPSSWLSGLTSTVSSFFGSSSFSESKGEQINFHDCAPYLFVSQSSCNVVSTWLPEGEEMDITKFRPNIVLTDSPAPWDEDFWGEVIIRSTSPDGTDGKELSIPLLHNCLRCASLNIDFATGKPGTGKAGEVLKMLQKDRRVDTGKKYSPVFGRYGFLKGECGIVRVGDEVRVSRRNDARTSFSGWLFDSERYAQGIC